MSSTEQKIIKKDGTWTVDGRPRESIKILAHHHPSNLPGKSLIALLLTLPPGAATPPHTHGGASVLGLMLHGASLNQMNENPPGTYHEGEVWFEAPGCHHVRSENASESPDEQATFYAVIIIDDEVLEKNGVEGVFVLDADQDEKKQQQ